jgi:antitoxin component of MazEF toxin-antitoxin module
MKKRIKKWGDSLIIRFSPDDVDLYNIKEGDIIDLPEEALNSKGEVYNIKQ